MNKYKLVACDLDGTLLNDAGEVSPENKTAIKKLADMGIYFVPATGRSISEILNITQIPGIQYIVSSNGAVINDLKNKEQIDFSMSEKEAQFVLDTVRKYNTYVIVKHDGKIHVKTKSHSIMKNLNVCSVVCGLVEDYGVVHEQFEEDIYSMDNMNGVVVFFRDDKDKELCKTILNNDDRVYAVDGWEHSIEIFSIDAGKDKALKKLSEKLGILQKEIITVGDSGNDIAMTKFAGVGLSVNNGCDELKNVADCVICSNNEHVADYLLKKYFK